MKHRFALSMHDMRASEPERTRAVALDLSRRFRAPLTVHLICDADTTGARALQDQTAPAQLEICFHGTTHRSPEGVAPWLAWYHKGQAELAHDDELLRARVRGAYARLADDNAVAAGICPPCWLAHANNRRDLRALAPAYLEWMTHFERDGRKRWSPIVSLGSDSPLELVGLRAFARVMLALGVRLRRLPIRVAIHPCDLERDDSMRFFDHVVEALRRRNFVPSLQRELAGVP